MERILFTTPILEYPAMGGPQLRIANSITALNQICDVRVFSRHNLDKENDATLHLFVSENCTEYIWANPYIYNLDAPRILQYSERLIRKIYDPRKRQHARIIENYVQQNHISTVWFGYGNISLGLIRQVRRLCPDTKIVCDTDSVWSRFVLRALPFSSIWRKPYVVISGMIAQRRETLMTQISDVLTAVSEIDREVYQAIPNKRATIMRFSNVVNLDMYDQSDLKNATIKRPAIYLAGTFGHKNSPMDYGCVWFLDEVLPLVKQTKPNVHLYIAGARSIERFGGYINQNVTVLGRMKDLVPYLCAMDVSIVPLFFESGTRYKILESAICGIPVVSTTLGVEGLELNHEEDLLVADSAQEFSNAITRMIEDSSLRSTLVASSRQKVEEMYVIQNLMQEGINILDYLATIGNTPR